jgi:hypothetical protein
LAQELLSIRKVFLSKLVFQTYSGYVASQFKKCKSISAIKQGEWTFAQADCYRKQLQAEFEQAFQSTKLPDRPDYSRANAFLIEARRRALGDELP